MNRINFLIGVTIGIMTMLLVINMHHPVKASTCAASAMAGGTNQLSKYNALQRLRQPTTDQGCSAASLAVGGQGGYVVRKMCGPGSCSVSSQDLAAQRLASPVAAPAAPVTANTR
jgi:hypothetical protein